MTRLSIQVLVAAVFYPVAEMIALTKKRAYPKPAAPWKKQKETGVFQFEMEAVKSSFVLDSGLAFEIKSAWVEHCWKYECIDNKAGLLKDTIWQLVIEAGYDDDIYLSDYWLMKMDVYPNESLGNHLGARLDFDYHGQDTFSLALVKQKDVAEPAQHIDTLRFFRKHGLY